MDNIEIEIRVKIKNSKSLISFLKKFAKFSYDDHQIDEYFIPKHRNFIASRPIKEWLRLRDSNGKFFINYKNWHYDKKGKSHYCDEYETKIENLNQMKKILIVLDFKSLIIVDKKRKAWVYKNYEISLDKVKGLGDFVEIEYKGKTKMKPSGVTKKMIEFLKEHNCGKIERDYVGYPFQVLFPREVKREEQ